MKKDLLVFIAILIILFYFPFVLSGTQHGINGFIDDSPRGISPNGMIVEFRIWRIDNYCNLSDIVGVEGNSKEDNWYAVDVGNCDIQWEEGDSVKIFIGNSTNNASTQVTLTDGGNDQAPDLILSDIVFCGDGYCDPNEECENCPEDCVSECNENTICEPIPNSTNQNMCETPQNCIDCYGCNENNICEPEIDENCFNCPFDCHCPDGLCQPEYGETNETCEEDCGNCGNLICETIEGLCFTFKETTLNCPIDCPGCVCGNMICEPACNENAITCPIDCVICDYDEVCDLGEAYPPCPDCQLSCGNLICEPEFDETPITCPTDCHLYCGNGKCEPEYGETWQSCPEDCYSARCGDKTCELAETSKNCCVDCGCPPEGCKVSKCVKNKCVPQCCLFGICCQGIICWYWWILIILILATLGFYFYKHKQKIRKYRLAHIPRFKKGKIRSIKIKKLKKKK